MIFFPRIAKLSFLDVTVCACFVSENITSHVTAVLLGQAYDCSCLALSTGKHIKKDDDSHKLFLNLLALDFLKGVLFGGCLLLWFSKLFGGADDGDSNKGDDDAAGFGDYVMLLNDQPENELTDLLSGPVFTDAQITFVVANPEGNPEETFEDAADLQISSPPDPPNNHEVEKSRQRKRNAGKSSSKSSKKEKDLMDSTNDDIPADQSQDNVEELIHKTQNGFLMQVRSRDEDSILRLSTFMVAKKIKELIKKDGLTIADLEEEANLSEVEDDLTKPRSLEKKMSKSGRPDNHFYNSDFYNLAYLSMEKRWLW
ncbi:hypothetical protein Tco_1316381 [Tanacetum coccineum]